MAEILLDSVSYCQILVVFQFFFLAKFRLFFILLDSRCFPNPQPQRICLTFVEAPTHLIWSSSRSAASWWWLHPIRSGRMQFEPKPDPTLTVDNLTIEWIILGRLCIINQVSNWWDIKDREDLIQMGQMVFIMSEFFRGKRDKILAWKRPS